jgi:hypothetical protein
VKATEAYQVNISNRFAALEILDDDDDDDVMWEITTENIKSSAINSLSYNELKQYKQ